MHGTGSKRKGKKRREGFIRWKRQRRQNVKEGCICEIERERLKNDGKGWKRKGRVKIKEEGREEGKGKEEGREEGERIKNGLKEVR